MRVLLSLSLSMLLIDLKWFLEAGDIFISAQQQANINKTENLISMSIASKLIIPCSMSLKSV